MIEYPKLYIGPMSKNIVDSVCENKDENIGLIPSRRQIEFDGGYVNDWKTKEFSSYVKSANPSVLIQRDHGGPMQGSLDDTGLVSFRQDILSGFDLLHIDPWKKTKDIEEGINETLKLIEYCLSINENSKFEIGTEQSIREFSPTELDYIFDRIKAGLGGKFNNVVYGEIQGGTGIVGTKNNGVFQEKRFKQMIGVCKKHNLLSKEHNGDYLSPLEIRTRFNLGLDAINIAPEFGFIETRTIMEEIYNSQDEYLFNSFFDLCYSSEKWKKWVNNDFKLTSFNKHAIIRISGHYVFSSPEFCDIKNNFFGIDDKIKNNLSNRMKEILCEIK